MSNPLVSIIIPAYNSEKYIAETLTSVLSQAYRPIEIIVVDDGSTDKTAKILKGCQTDKTNESSEINLTYIYQQNSGPSKARNTGIKAAKGEYIAFLDADDLWTKTKLEKQVNYMTNNSDVSLVFGDMSVFDSKGIIIDSSFKKYGYPQCDEGRKVLNAFENLLERNYISTGTVFLKKGCFNKAGYFDESIRHGEDYDLWLRVSLMYEIGCIPEVLRLKRMHDSNLSKSEESFYRSKIYILDKINRNYSKVIKKRGFNVRNCISKTIKELSYLYYLQKRYISAIKTFAQYISFILMQRIPKASTYKA